MLYRCRNFTLSRAICYRLFAYRTFHLYALPGTLILLENNYPGLGVTAYALMAAGGDFGASVAPQTLGIVVDKISCSDFAINLSSSLSLTTEQIAMKIGMILSSVFPVLGVVVLLIIKKHFRKA